MPNRDTSSKANPAAIAAMLHYLSVDIQGEHPEAAEIMREAALELEALCCYRGAKSTVVQLPLNVEDLLRSVGHA